MGNDSQNEQKNPAPTIRPRWPRIRPFLVASAVVSAAALTAPVLQRLPHANLSLLFMTGVLIVAVRYGVWPSVYASLLSFLIFNFFFTEPFYTLKVSEEGDVATLVFFLVMASLSGNLASRMRDAMTKRERANARTAVLQVMTRRIAGAATRSQVLQILVDQLAVNFDCVVVAVAAADTGGETMKVSSDGRALETGHGWDDLLQATAKLPGWTILPVKAGRGRIAAVAMNRNVLTKEEREYAMTLTDQAAVALERTMLVADLEDAKLASQREQLRVALLSSVSHDLRTPLSSVIGAASSLLAYESSLGQDDRRLLLQSIVEEAERLDRYIQNLLDMTRLGQGQFEAQRDWEDVRDLVSAASRRLHLVSRGLRIEMIVADDAQLIYAQGDLIEQVFVNLLDNAARYSPANGTIRIKAAKEADEIVIEVSDDGPGIPAADREKVFDPFYRVPQGDRKSGTGLGLSICRGIVRAHGGEVTAHANPDGAGSLLRLKIPQASGESRQTSNV
jgi:two-component system sensor histidine kinase KdpD